MSSGFWAWAPRESESGIDDRIRLPRLTSAWDRILVGRGATAVCRRKAQNDDLLCKIWKCAFYNAVLEGLTHQLTDGGPSATPKLPSGVAGPPLVKRRVRCRVLRPPEKTAGAGRGPRRRVPLLLWSRARTTEPVRRRVRNPTSPPRRLFLHSLHKMPTAFDAGPTQRTGTESPEPKGRWPKRRAGTEPSGERPPDCDPGRR